MKSIRSGILGLFVIVAASACSSTGVGNPDLSSDEAALVADGQEGTRADDVSNSVALVPLIPLDTAAKVTTPDVAATNAEDAIVGFSPAGCATKSHVAGSGHVAYTFARVGVLACRGPLGLQAYEGTIDATFSSTAAGTIDVNVQSTGLRIDGVAVSHQSTLHVSFGAGVRETHATSSFSTTGPRGAVTHTSDHTWSYDLSSLCFALDGTSTSTVGPRTHSATVKNYVRCGTKAACPNANGTLELTRGDGIVKLVITFLGGTSYDVYVPARDLHEQRDDLVCTP